MREITDQGYRVQLDLSTQVLQLSLPEDLSYGGQEGKQEAPIAATLSGGDSKEFVSASVLAQKAKQFDDGLYAAVELAAEKGTGQFSGKAAMLRSVMQALVEQPTEAGHPAPAVIFAAGKLGNLDVAPPAAAQEGVKRLIDEFLGNELRSKPIAFYTWSSDLAAIFQQDRMLQTELKDQSGTAAIVAALHADSQARSTYEAYLGLVSRLTNPLVYADLRKAITNLDRGVLNVPSQDIYFLPPSRAHETDLIKKLYGTQPIPEGFSLVDEMIRRIQSGQLALRPTDDSGWYDYQTWSLEPLVIPEKMREHEHLEFDPSYAKQLLELFKGILALTRETHIKQLEIPMVGSAMPRPETVIRIRPELSAEPLATHYYRRAWSYVYIRWVLEQVFGAPALEQLHRLTAAGPVAMNLADELHAMQSLLYGAHVSVCRQIGMTPVVSPQLGSGKGDQSDAAPFAAWREKLETDPDVGQDARMMVPVFFDRQRGKTKVWVLLGWARRPVEVGFAKNPEAVVFDKDGQRLGGAAPRLDFHSVRYSLSYPVTAEVYVTKILNRDEFRRHCDQYKTRSEILKNLL